VIWVEIFPFIWITLKFVVEPVTYHVNWMWHDSMKLVLRFYSCNRILTKLHLIHVKLRNWFASFGFPKVCISNMNAGFLCRFLKQRFEEQCWSLLSVFPLCTMKQKILKCIFNTRLNRKRDSQNFLMGISICEACIWM